MRAIVLVGGEGTRLRPLTYHTAKQLAPLLNRPLLSHLLEHLCEHGIEQITLAMTRTPASEAVRAAFGDGASLGVQIGYVYEETPLGSGGAIAGAAAGWDERFLVCNGDIITDLDVSAMLEAHRERGAELSISLHEVDDPSPFGVVERGAGERIARFVEKPSREEAPSHLINAGTWIFEPTLLAEMDAARFNRVEDGLFPSMAAGGRAIFGFHHAGFWTDVGNPDAYLAVNLDLLRGAVPSRLPRGWPADGVMAQGATMEDGAQVAAPLLLGPGARVRSGSRLRGPVSAGARCVIERNAEVSESVLWEDVTVGESASVHRSILASGVTVGAGARLDGAVVAHGATIGAGERLPAGTIVEPDVHAATTGA